MSSSMRSGGEVGEFAAGAHLLTGIALCLTIIGIPLGLANLKLIPGTMTPLGRDIVPIRQARGQIVVAVPADPSGR